MGPKAIIFNPEMDQLLADLYPCLANNEIAEIFGCNTRSIEYHGSKRLGVHKTKECKRSTANATKWTNEMISWLQDNFYSKTNHELADHLGTRLTVLRNKTRELGLKRIDVENWTTEQIAYLVANYKTMGDVEIMENLQRLYPRSIPWVRGHIHKKLTLLKIHRTREEQQSIIAKHMQPGGRSYTILRNSSSVNMHDGWVANMMAWRNADLRKEILKNPQLIELKRQEIILNRVIKECKNAT